ncbi:hypothetical protein Ahy_A03g016726 [Arachis hypogaea]|uniref:PGG domain-containing protein n=1 Tax=Arachis hypogaea TaxID=3818 RepID=A0A445E471_ARAHY|nr:hypothetical protein Ahy_A03g016726 [Arachis hypogaea]
MANNVSPLEEAALSGDIDRLYALIQGDPDILNDADAKPFVSTPLHIAASVDLRTNPEIMVLMPSFALKLNQQGFSPVHLAIQNGHSKLARRLVDMNKELARVKGREGTTPLHLVSQIGDCELLTFFLSACPDSIEDVNARDETALHVAVRYQQFDALRVLVGWFNGNTRKGAESLERSILNWRDVAGNTILHLSVYIYAASLMLFDLLLQNLEMIDLNVKNSEKKTALDEATGGSEDMKSKLLKAGARLGPSLEDDPTQTPAYRLLTKMRRIRGNISDNQRDAYLVVAALILTAVYQSVLSPPGGLYQADASNLNATSSLNSAAGKSVLSTVNCNFLRWHQLFLFFGNYKPPTAGQMTLLIVFLYSGVIISFLFNGSRFDAYFATTLSTVIQNMMRLPKRFTRRNNNAILSWQLLKFRVGSGGGFHSTTPVSVSKCRPFAVFVL